ncbi:MAG TPA: hypothetical protein VFZ53_02555, partial [Polyangiaceae bacterium]
MLAWRHPLIWAFAGGCLSGAALIGFWPSASDRVSPSTASARPAERDQDPTSAGPRDDDVPTAAVTDDDAA